jgi:tetratricopeptide (TPR) repeat protein
VKRAFLRVAVLAWLAAACGPEIAGAPVIYVGRRGDTLAALNARLAAGDARLARGLARVSARDPRAPFAAGERVLLSTGAFKGKQGRAALAVLAAAAAAREGLARDDVAAALPGLERARAAFPADPALAYELGWAYVRAGDYARAEDTLGAAAALTPDDEEVAVALALARLRRGEASAAAAAWAAWLAAHPDFTFGYFVAGELGTAAGTFPEGRHAYFEYLGRRPEGVTAAFAREGIKAGARAELARAATAATAEPEEKAGGPMAATAER